MGRKRQASTDPKIMARTAASRRYRERHPAKAKAMTAAWRAKNPNYQAEWRAKNKEKHQRMMRELKYKCVQRYPCPEFCECCGVRMADTPKGPQFDHCHASPFHRGWLCNSCNNAIARLGDNLEGVLRAVEYLKRADAAQWLN